MNAQRGDSKENETGIALFAKQKKQIEKSRQKEFKELRIASQETLIRYGKYETHRGDRKQAKPLSTGDCRADEANELRYYQAIYDRERTRLKRIRQKNGTNPRGVK